jgi:hypothetical protein
MDYRSREEAYLRKEADLDQAIAQGNPNVIYDDTIIKYTINLPIALYAKITKKAKSKYGGRRSQFIRDVLEKALQDEAPISFSRLVSITEKRVAEKPSLQHEFEFKRACLMAWYRKTFFPKKQMNVDPPRRYHGVEQGLMDNTSKAIRFKIQKEKYLDSAL